MKKVDSYTLLLKCGMTLIFFDEYLEEIFIDYNDNKNDFY